MAAQFDKRDFVWKIIGRFDTYIGSVNSKAAIMVAFNTFAIAGVALKWSDILKLYEGTPWALNWTTGLLFIASVAACASLIFTFRAINPFLESPANPPSKVFFEHVSKHWTNDKYHDAIVNLTEDEALKDLSDQAHIIAKGLTSKFTEMRRATWAAIVLTACIIGMLFVWLIYVGSVGGVQPGRGIDKSGQLEPGVNSGAPASPQPTGH